MWKVWTLYGGLFFRGLREPGSTPSTTLHSIHTHKPHFLSKIDTCSDFFLDHSLASVSHLIGP